MKIYTVDELVSVAKRDNNTKRPYLYVNPIQGKHIPVVPSKALELYKFMGEVLFEKYSKEKILVIGFAETATAVGAAISCFADNVIWCTQTTREKYNNAEYLNFTESHSHATEQSVIINGLSEVIHNIDRIVFAEDEVTTGNTIVKLINAIKDHFSNVDVKYSIISILNSMTEERIQKLNRQGTDCLFVDKIPFEYRLNSLKDYIYSAENEYGEIYNNEYEIIQTMCSNLRYVQKKKEYEKSLSSYVEDVILKCDITNEEKILVLGTEEFMYPPLLVANKLEEQYPDRIIRFHATTRSPILPSNSNGYPLYRRNLIRSMYDIARNTYVYNLEDYDLVIVLSDSKVVSIESMKSICGALKNAGSKRIIFGKE